MAQASKIEWTDATWNCVRGCSRVSQGCRNCYAERAAGRFAGLYIPDSAAAHIASPPPFFGFVTEVNGHPAWTGKVELVESKLEEPLHWKNPRRIFVNSMSDLFHEALLFSDIYKVFDVMRRCPHHTFQVLTKRPTEMRAMVTNWTRQFETILPNVWLGVSVENQPTADERIPLLLQTPAAIRFVSYEPALGPVNFFDYMSYWANEVSPTRIESKPLLDWIIVGGESGPGARPFDIGWAREAVRQGKLAGVPVFVKQLGADPREGNAGGNCRNVDCTHPDCGYIRLKLRDRKGGDMSAWPEDLRVREHPVSRVREVSAGAV